MAKRFKAYVVVPSDVPHSSEREKVDGLFPTHDRALKAGIDAAVAAGLIVVEEVDAKQKVTREWVEDGD